MSSDSGRREVLLVDTVRALVAGEPAGHGVWQSLLWCAGILTVFMPLAVRQYRGDGF